MSKCHRNNTNVYFSLPSFPKYYSRLSIIRIVLSIGVTSFRSAFFLLCLSSGCPSIEIAVLAVFQNRCGICQFVPLDHRPPPTDLQLLHFPPPFLFAVLSTTVSWPTHLLLRFFTEFQVLSSLFSTNIPSTSSPFLLFHLFIVFPLFLLRISFSVFTLSLRIDLPISFRTFSKNFFLCRPTDTPQIFLPVGSQKNHGDPKISFICLNLSIRSGHSEREPSIFQ